MSKDVASGLACIVIGGVFFFATYDIRISETGLIGPHVVPQIIAASVIVLGVALMVTGWQTAISDGTEEPLFEAPLRAIGVVAAGAAFVWLFGLVGYITATWITGIATLHLFGVRPIWRAAVCSLAMALAYHAFFVELMGVYVSAGGTIDPGRILGL